jgi:glycosyltransferase involved in cell wall biosynthesis
MKIAQVAPLVESVPPRFYGGTERVVHYLTEELVRQGHDVTLFASGDSLTAAELVPCGEKALRSSPQVQDPIPHYMMMLEKVRRRAREFDVIHFHIDCLHFPLFREMSARTVTTLHGRLDLPGLVPLYQEFNDMPLVSISRHQRRPMPDVLWAGNVYHGLPLDLYAISRPSDGGYVAFLGRICPEKRVDRAIEMARRAGVKLRIAAKVDSIDRVYFERKIRPLLSHPLIEYLGEIDEREKGAFLGGAKAVLFPIDWPEPFGLVMIEAMACGTPVIAYPSGSVPEVVEHGVTGFIVENIDQAVAALGKLDTFDGGVIRRRFERRFTVARMARDYVKIYRALREPERLPMPAVGTGLLAGTGVGVGFAD